MSVNSFGGPGETLNAPPLAEWAAAVAQTLDSRDETVDTRVAAAVAAALGTLPTLTTVPTTGRFALTKGSQVIELGSTGRRDITATVTWDAVTFDPGTAKTFHVRRVGDRVSVNIAYRSLNVMAAGATLIDGFPVGFRPSQSIYGLLVNNSTELSSTGAWAMSNLGVFTGRNAGPANCLTTVSATWVTTEAWPTVLPGNAA